MTYEALAEERPGQGRIDASVWLGVCVPVGVPLTDWVGVREPEGERVGEPVETEEGVALFVPDCVGERDMEREPV